jgi:hypothetical protein
MLDCYFFDILGEWDKLQPYVNDEKFKLKLKMYKWWNFKDVNSNQPLIDIFNGKTTNPDMINDLTYIKDKIKVSTYRDVWWYCSPGDCIESSALILSTLLSLAFKQDFYIIHVGPNDNKWNSHQLLCNKKLDITTLRLIRDNNGKLITRKHNNEDIILYDLIYPLVPFFGKSWDNREQQLDTLQILHNCSDVRLNNISMGYYNYCAKSDNT